MSFFSTAGPAIVRMPTPSSSRTMYARLVLPRPGGPASSTWSSASPRAFAAVERDLELLLDALLADELVEPARAEADVELPPRPRSSTGATNELMLPSAGPAAHAPRASRRIGLARARARRRRSSSRARRARRARRRGRRCRAPATGAIAVTRELLLQLEHDALGRLLADAGDRLEADGVLAHDRAAQLVGRRAGDDRERHLRADAVHAQELHEELALGALGEAVELHDVSSRTCRYVSTIDLLGAVGLAQRARRRRDEVADAADVEDEALRRRRDRLAAQARDHVLSPPSSGAAARAHGRSRRRARRPRGSGSAAPASPRIAFTIRCTCAFSARP